MTSILFIAFLVMLVIGVPIACALGMASVFAALLRKPHAFVAFTAKRLTVLIRSLHGNSVIPACREYYGRSQNLR